MSAFPLKGKPWVIAGYILFAICSYYLGNLAFTGKSELYVFVTTPMHAAAILIIYAYARQMPPSYAIKFFMAIVSVGIVSGYLIESGYFAAGFFGGNVIQGAIDKWVYNDARMLL